MKTFQFGWSHANGFEAGSGAVQPDPNVVLFFGSRKAFDLGAFGALRERFPDSLLLGCSTGGQFDRDAIEDDVVFGIGARFRNAQCRLAATDIVSAEESEACGARLGKQLAAEDLAAVLVISDGLMVNGSALVAGITSMVGQGVTVSGGLAGDGSAFEQTIVAANAPPKSGVVAALGFYGRDLVIGTGSAGGWDTFGPRRTITKSQGNVLYELDGKPALDLYERYLGEDEVQALPGSALLFPLQIDDPQRAGRDVMRTILAVDREKRTMTFAGDMPPGWTAQLMRGHFDRLADGAATAARQSVESDIEGDGFSVLVSCIGRRLLMGQRAMDEVAAAAEQISRRHALVGFYSYGEISPHAKSGFCQLHNQTMTVFTLQERIG
jgi:hypothetical protein